MSPIFTSHVSSDRLGEAASHAGLDGLPETERRHVQGCDQCKRLYAGYRLTDRLLATGWQHAALPVAGPELQPRAGLLGRLDGTGPTPRSLAAIALFLCLATLVGFGLLLPVLAPLKNSAASPSQTIALAPTPSAGTTAGNNAVVSPPGSPAAPGSPEMGTGGTPVKPGPTQGNPATTPTPAAPIALASLTGWPVAWAPDGGHLLVAHGTGWTMQHQIEVVDSFGRMTGSFTAASATWVNSSTIAIATDGQGPGGSVTVELVNLKGTVTATLPGQYPQSGGGSTGAVLLGSGTGLVAIATHGGWGPSASTFVIWDGHAAGPAHQGMPIAFSDDGTRLAVLHPSGGFGGSSSGWLEIVSVPDLQTIASYPHALIHASTAGNGPGYAPDIAFSPDGGRLFASGTLIDLSSGASVQAGEGGWLPDGTLLTSQGGRVLRWQGMHSVTGPTLSAGGTVVTSRHGDVVEFFNDGRPTVLLTAGGTLEQLDLPGIASIDDAQLAPDGGALAITGHGTNGARVTAVATLS
ncbi:MAG: anti-sigma factor family protein [Candidatus Limnocylindrales bacterium]